MSGERSRKVDRRNLRKVLRTAERSGRSVARRNARLAVESSSAVMPEQFTAIAAAAAAAASAEPRGARRHSPATATPAQATVRARTLLLGLVAIAALASSLSMADIQQSAAWLTASQTRDGNSVSAAEVKVGGLGPDLDPTAKLSVANILPMPTTAVDDGRAPSIDLVVRNTGTVPINWMLSLKDVATSAGQVDMGAITNVSYRLDDGAWSTPTKLGSLEPISGTNLPAGDGGNRVTVTVRFWFDPDVDNSAQGARAEFTTLLEAIQTGVA